jgi:hypothetical protein
MKLTVKQLIKLGPAIVALDKVPLRGKNLFAASTVVGALYPHIERAEKAQLAIYHKHGTAESFNQFKIAADKQPLVESELLELLDQEVEVPLEPTLPSELFDSVDFEPGHYRALSIFFLKTD